MFKTDEPMPEIKLANLSAAAVKALRWVQGGRYKNSDIESLAALHITDEYVHAANGFVLLAAKVGALLQPGGIGRGTVHLHKLAKNTVYSISALLRSPAYRDLHFNAEDQVFVTAFNAGYLLQALKGFDADEPVMLRFYGIHNQRVHHVLVIQSGADAEEVKRTACVMGMNINDTVLNHRTYKIYGPRTVYALGEPEPTPEPAPDVVISEPKPAASVYACTPEDINEKC